MKTSELAKLLNGEVITMFDYSVDKKKSFYTIQLNCAPSLEQVKIALDNGLRFVAEILNVDEGSGFIQKVVYTARPKNGVSYEFATE